MKRKFLNWYSHLRFGKKLLLIHSMTAGVVMLLLLLSMASIYIYSQRNQLLEQTASQAKMFGENLTATLTFDDKGSAREALASLRNSPYVRYAALFNAQGKRFAEFSRNNDQRAGQLPPDLKLADRLGQTYQFSWKSLHYLHVVKLDNEKVGYFYIESDAAPIYKQATFFIILSLIAIYFAGAIGLLLLNRLQMLLMAPLHSLIK
ncbi:MAG: CHASE sensor domain-containing protein, partial [Methylophilaceae bacterium]